MNSRKAYWFKQPYMPEILNIAVQPIIDPRDERLCFRVPGDDPPWGGIWGLVGKIVKDEGDYFEFQCDDSVMHARGGLYKFTALNLQDFRHKTCKWIPMGKEIAQACKITDDLHYWYRKNWPNTRLYEISEWEMRDNPCTGRRTDS